MTVALALWILFQLATLAQADFGDECPNLSPQKGIDLDQLQGTWYVVQAAIHRYNCTLADGGDLGCSVFFIDRTEKNKLILTWRQEPPLEELQFEITVIDAESPGFWHALQLENRNGSQPDVIQVMKAVGDHLVLSFCDRAHNIFTAILGRKNHIKKKQIQAINVMLQRRGLSIVSAKIMSHSFCHRHKLWRQGAQGHRSSATYGALPSSAFALFTALIASRVT
ncbi:uncharacterized protein LOC132198835 [Neocloeon triangulifer]|uniref:uncharacterized protein LOC132198835 n=1 Tax=Neocloeon triangulifer TaxID=2078957 RepID=UPI00286F6059|nr:uncharacterized protein LOC132198835 [Neocloeon triangulifer]